MPVSAFFTPFINQIKQWLQAKLNGVGERLLKSESKTGSSLSVAGNSQGNIYQNCTFNLILPDASQAIESTHTLQAPPQRQVEDAESPLGLPPTISRTRRTRNRPF
jgi:hypothetical protein